MKLSVTRATLFGLLLLMILRRCLEDRMTLTELEEVLKLALRGLGIPSNRIPALLNKARAFAKTLQDQK